MEVYLMLQFVIQPTDNPVLGDVYYRERIQMQVFVCDILNKGTGSSITIAESIRALLESNLLLFSQENSKIINHIISLSSGKL